MEILPVMIAAAIGCTAGFLVTAFLYASKIAALRLQNKIAEQKKCVSIISQHQKLETEIVFKEQTIHTLPRPCQRV